MAYEVTLSCDNRTCDEKVVVPQVGAMPSSWVALRHQVPEVSTLRPNVQNAENGVRALAFCCIDCVMEYLNGRR